MDKLLPHWADFVEGEIVTSNDIIATDQRNFTSIYPLPCFTTISIALNNLSRSMDEVQTKSKVLSFVITDTQHDGSSCLLLDKTSVWIPRSTCVISATLIQPKFDENEANNDLGASHFRVFEDSSNRMTLLFGKPDFPCYIWNESNQFKYRRNSHTSYQ